MFSGLEVLFESIKQLYLWRVFLLLQLDAFLCLLKTHWSIFPLLSPIEENAYFRSLMCLHLTNDWTIGRMKVFFSMWNGGSPLVLQGIVASYCWGVWAGGIPSYSRWKRGTFFHWSKHKINPCTSWESQVAFSINSGAAFSEVVLFGASHKSYWVHFRKSTSTSVSGSHL